MGVHSEMMYPILDQLEDISDSLDATVEGVTPMSPAQH